MLVQHGPCLLLREAQLGMERGDRRSMLNGCVLYVDLRGHHLYT
jgi:hypothetical protein